MYVSLNGGQKWHPVASRTAACSHARPRRASSGSRLGDRDPRPLGVHTGRCGAFAHAGARSCDLKPATTRVRGSGGHSLSTVAPVHEPWQRGCGMFIGENRPYGALVTYSIAPTAESADGATTKVSVEVLDDAGATVRTFEGPAEPGVNRTAWDLRRNPIRLPPAEVTSAPSLHPGPQVLPGRYTRSHRARGRGSIRDGRGPRGSEIRRPDRGPAREAGLPHHRGPARGSRHGSSQSSAIREARRRPRGRTSPGQPRGKRQHRQGAGIGRWRPQGGAHRRGGAVHRRHDELLSRRRAPADSGDGELARRRATADFGPHRRRCPRHVHPRHATRPPRRSGYTCRRSKRT